MRRRILTVVILSLIFGVPIIWYLFLQLFGENKFVLPIQEETVVSTSCLNNEITFFYQERFEESIEKNQFRRIQQYSETNSFSFMLYDSSCFVKDYSKADILLVNHRGDLVSVYDYSILEVDRAIAEADLLKLLIDESSN